MFLGFVGAIAGGICLAGVLLILSKLFRLQMPGWTYPAAAGIGMLGIGVYIEYSWYGRTVAEFPPSFEVIESFSDTSFIQPWTYVFPRTDRFIIVDHDGARLNENVPNTVLVDVYLMERMRPTIQATQFIRCDTGERLLADDSMNLDDDGLPVGEDWVDPQPDSPLIQAVCQQQGLPES